MDNALQALLSWQFLMFSLGVFTIVWMIRTIVEYAIPKSDGAPVWDKLLLPLLPPMIGVLAAVIAKAYPYPDSITTMSGRVFFGMVTGVLSGLVYQVVNGILKSRVEAVANQYIPTAQPVVATLPQPPNPAGPPNPPQNMNK